MKQRFSSLLGGLLAVVIAGVLALGFWPAAPDVPKLGGHGKAGDPTPPNNPDRRGAGQVVSVQAGESIQAAVDRAQPGDTIRVMPGVYNEEVLVSAESITLEGVVQGDQRPTLDGQGQKANGVVSVGDYFTITGFKIIHYTSNGVQAQGVTSAVFRDVVTDDTGEYGLFPILSTDVLIEQCQTSGVNDTGIYVGQSRQIVVRDNEAFGNVSGFEIENSVDALVEDNSSHDNTAGLLVFLLPGKTAAEGSNTRVVNNRFENNNLANFSRPEMTVHLVPPGSGLLIMSADSTEVTGNTFSGNKSFAVALVAMSDFPEFFGDKKEWDVPVVPEDNWIHDNTYVNNGYDPDQGVIDAGFKGRDLLWSTSGDGNRWDDPGATRFPSPLPSSAWPGFVSRAFGRVLNFLAHL
ncbi:MAG TPA: parallel beta-helix domain-containing protein [Anaerolineales bacterium]|nr:parallel beta-helix domain-containing protein [Anaerolineales bacterium]